MRIRYLKQNNTQVKLNIQKDLDFSEVHLAFKYLGTDREYAKSPLKS